MGKILRRCTICQKLGAIYQVTKTDQLIGGIYCAACWKALVAPTLKTPPADEPTAGKPTAQKPESQS